MKSYFVSSGDVKIHVLENGVTSDIYPPLLIIGGLWEPAERAIPVISSLKSRAVALSLRGRGLSSTPKTGYDLDDHLSDIDAVVRYCGLKNTARSGFRAGCRMRWAGALNIRKICAASYSLTSLPCT